MQMTQDYSTCHRISILIDMYNLMGLGPCAMGLTGLGLGWTDDLEPMTNAVSMDPQIIFIRRKVEFHGSFTTNR